MNELAEIGQKITLQIDEIATPVIIPFTPIQTPIQEIVGLLPPAIAIINKIDAVSKEIDKNGYFAFSHVKIKTTRNTKNTKKYPFFEM